MTYGYMVQQMLIPALSGAGEVDTRVEGGKKVTAPRHSFHAFRHAAASLWIEQKLSAKRVQTLMGHSSITMTFDVYGHLFEQQQSDQEVAASMETQHYAGKARSTAVRLRILIPSIEVRILAGHPSA